MCWLNIVSSELFFYSIKTWLIKNSTYPQYKLLNCLLSKKTWIYKDIIKIGEKASRLLSCFMYIILKEIETLIQLTLQSPELTKNQKVIRFGRIIHHIWIKWIILVKKNLKILIKSFYRIKLMILGIDKKNRKYEW